MSYQVLARKWRPRRFSELVGQEHVVRALSNALDGDRLHHAFLFTGTRGVGKTTIARIFAKSLNCERGQSSQPCGECRACLDIDAGRFVDLLEIDAASHTGVDDVREMIESAQYTPARGRQKVFLIDEVHMLSKNAFNALLKTLEEPPAHVKFLLATTDPQKLPVTVLSRCLKFNLKRLLPEQIAGQMRHILDAEQLGFDAEAVALLAKGADGSLRDGLSLLDQAIAYGGGAVRAAEVRAMLGTIERAQVTRLLDAVVADDGAALFAEVNKLAEFAPDFGLVLDDLAALLHRIQLRQLVPDLPDEGADAEDVARFAQQLGADAVQLYYQLCISGRRDLALAPTPRAGFDMALLRLLAFAPAGEAGEAGGGAAPVQRAAGGAAAGSSAGSGAARLQPVREHTPAYGAMPTMNAAPALAPEPAVRRSESVAAPNGDAAAQARAAIAALDADAVRRAPIQAPAAAAPAPTPVVSSVAPAAETAPRGHAAVAASVVDAAPVHEAAVAQGIPARSAVALEPRDWASLIERADLRGPVGQLARNAALVAVDGDMLRLALAAEHYNVLVPAMVTQLQEKLSAATGRPLRCHFEQARGNLDTPAEQLARSRSARQLQAEEDMERDPFVQAAMREFGARIVPNSVRPGDTTH
ncbi:MAG: DNA polymerase III, subunit gamma and tau [Lysobacterales bacterium 69-70]|nr:DNA polymerase III subunit gamma/tau [Xanthomonadaceae bacterium]ODU32041.1 MAG: DNA polymerase III, subunit gamma and tau [Xanthomonadaceae bacterium SCN 69-320]ODV20096.1 MAG: DNA polymerase III, subunit gamma and tau [Xanthomonadaceae bacterium SCN 69-25]OJZ01764.1 MAG: DNA polymerase III, subunit gamma and tau [Xanthomonadales bacterium 69-70]